MKKKSNTKRKPKKKKNIKNKKEFNLKNVSILEILALLLIISVLLVVISPLFTKAQDEINKRKYIKNVNAYIDRTISMYGNNKYKDKFIKNGDNYTIKLSDIDKVNITKDPYGFTYKQEESYITFNSKNKEIIVNIKSCITKEAVEYCYEIADVNTKDLHPNSIKTSIN